ncbi:MAG: hypothetical protein MJY98_04650 [Fibrobacter sp.]|nr:hypothetical protein [Fibrobacter sp.]
MKSILFVIVASALISIVPFLITFDPECVPFRGIMIYSIFAILMLFTNIKERLQNKKKKAIAFAITYILVATISCIDSQAIYTLLKIDSILYDLIPFVTTAIGLLILKDAKAIPIRHINLALFSTLFLHLAMSNTDIAQPILTFTLIGLIH